MDGEREGEGKKPKKRSILKRLSFLTGNLEEAMSDNAFITVYPLGGQYFCYYESPFAHRVDPDTLRTLARVDLNRRLRLVHSACHVHWDGAGNMYSMGMRLGPRGPAYVINKTVPKQTGEQL